MRWSAFSTCSLSFVKSSDAGMMDLPVASKASPILLLLRNADTGRCGEVVDGV
jgi:hypothetical protein